MPDSLGLCCTNPDRKGSEANFGQMQVELELPKNCEYILPGDRRKRPGVQMQNSAGTSNSNEGKIVSVKYLVWENDYPAELLEISTTGDFRKLRLISDSVPRKVTEFQFNSHWLTRRQRHLFRNASPNPSHSDQK